MSVALLKQMRSALASLQAQVVKYESAIEVAEKEAAIVVDGTFKGAFTRKMKKAKRGAYRKVPKVIVTHGGVPMDATRTGQARRGAVKAFVAAHADLTKSAAEEGARLLPLARAAGIPTTKASLTIRIAMMRKEQPETADLDAAVLAHVKEFGPMPYTAVADWFSEVYPDAREKQPRRAKMALQALEAAGKAHLTSDGWWEAAETTAV